MRKRSKVLLIFLVIMTLILGSTISYAKGNISKIEEKWLEFQEALSDRLVKEGIMSQNDAAEKLKEFEDKAKSSSEDFIYQHFAKVKKPTFSRNKNMNTLPAAIYSRITNQSLRKVIKECKDSNITVWQLAQNQGKLDELKQEFIAELKNIMDKLVEKGMMSSQQRQEALDKIIETIKSGNYPQEFKELLP